MTKSFIQQGIGFGAVLAAAVMFASLCGNTSVAADEFEATAAREAVTPSSVEPGRCSGSGANPWTYNFEVDGRPAKVLNDAALVQPINGGLIVGQSPEVLARALKRRFLNGTHTFGENSVLYVVDWEGEGLLFDAGSGPGEAPVLGFGMVFEHLEAEGIARSSIKHVFVTHGHFDHLVGVVEDLESLTPAYPAATIHISRAEYDFWMADTVNRSTSILPDELWEYGINTARAVLGAVKHQLKTFEAEEEPFPGIATLSTPWHTPGSVAYVIPDGDSKLVFSGDSVTHRVLSIENPWIGLVSDTTPEATTAGRYALLDEVAAKGWQLMSGHVAFPGLLHVEHEGVNFKTTARGYQGSGASMSVCA